MLILIYQLLLSCPNFTIKSCTKFEPLEIKIAVNIIPKKGIVLLISSKLKISSLVPIHITKETINAPILSIDTLPCLPYHF